MRVITGKFRGRRLATVPPGVRPTSDRLRESLFNVLGTSVPGSYWVDLFAGTGAVGIEALSRGARFVLFNERDIRAYRCLRRNLELCGIAEGFQALRKDALGLAGQLSSAEPADFVFVDPPYAFKGYQRLFQLLAQSPVVGEETLVLLEVFKKQSLDFLGSAWEELRRIEAGDSILFILRKSERPVEKTEPPVKSSN